MKTKVLDITTRMVKNSSQDYAEKQIITVEFVPPVLARVFKRERATRRVIERIGKLFVYRDTKQRVPDDIVQQLDLT